VQLANQRIGEPLDLRQEQLIAVFDKVSIGEPVKGKANGKIRQPSLLDEEK